MFCWRYYLRLWLEHNQCTYASVQTYGLFCVCVCLCVRTMVGPGIVTQYFKCRVGLNLLLRWKGLGDFSRDEAQSINKWLLTIPRLFHEPWPSDPNRLYCERLYVTTESEIRQHRTTPLSPLSFVCTVNVICRENGFRENYLKYELITENLWWERTTGIN